MLNHIKNIGLLFRDLSKTNLIKTIYMNFHYLPLRQALHFPIYVYGRMEIRHPRTNQGKLVIADQIVRRGVIKIGKRDAYVNTSAQKTIWTIAGTLKFDIAVWFMHGTYLMVAKNGILTFCKGDCRQQEEKPLLWTMIGSNSKIMCFEKVTIEHNVRITWEVQIYDTSFHYVQSLETGDIGGLTKPIVIKANCWIGNRCTISKGAFLPESSILAGGSLLNKDFSGQERYTMFVGSPAMPKRTGLKRIFDERRQSELDMQFGYGRTRL